MSITYCIKQGTEGADAVVLKSGHEVEFKMSEVKAHKEKMEAFKRELEAQIALEEAKRRNVADNHPVVTGLTDEQMAAVSIFYASKGIQKKSEEKLGEVSEVLSGYADELAEIERQTGLSL